MPLRKDAIDITRLGRSAVFGLVAASLGVVGAMVSGVGLVFLLPGIILGLAFGLIPFEGEKMATYVVISAAFNFFVYMGCFYCVSLVWTRMRTKNA